TSLVSTTLPSASRSCLLTLGLVFALLLSLGSCFSLFFFFFFNGPATPGIYPLSLHDALPILERRRGAWARSSSTPAGELCRVTRSEEHTSELQSLTNLVCRLLLEKKKHRKVNPRSPPDVHRHPPAFSTKWITSTQWSLRQSPS